MRPSFVILAICLLWQPFAGAQDQSPNRPTRSFKTLAASEFSWMPSTASELVARQCSDPSHDDNSTAVTFVCSYADVDAVTAYFVEQVRRSYWFRGSLPTREKTNVLPELKKLGFTGRLLPTGSHLDVLILPDDHYPTGPYLIVDHHSRRIWYLVIDP